MMLHVWIQVRTRSCESRTFALRDGVHVDGVLAWRKVHQVQTNAHALPRRRKFRRANALPLPIAQVDLDGRFLRGSRKSK